MLQNIVEFKAQSFLSERNTSTMAYEVKAVRAIWDPSLSIPGTNRRGGWRCPVGTRYGGQITDRFGRSCGWGVARRIANQISDIGQRLENVDDARRGRRIARRERRILARLNPQDARAGRLERGLRGVADRLEDADTPSPRGARRRTVVARPPSVDTPEGPRELTPAPRPQRRRRAPNLRDSEQRRIDREIDQPGAPRTGEAPVRPARRRQPARPRGEGNLRESEQRRMEREIEQPGAPRTGEAPARRRRRAVVEATKKPKAPTQQEAKPRPQVEPKIVKPRRPKPKVDVREPDPALERLLDEEEVSRRVRRGENVDIGNPPKGFKEVGNGRWRKGDWYIAVDQNEDQVLGLTASNGQGGIVQARNFDELVKKMNAVDARPQRGNSDNAARSEELRQAQVDRARGAGRKVDLNQILNERFFGRYIREDIIPNDRIMIVNDPANFPNGTAARKTKRAEAIQKINRADSGLNKIEQAIARGELSDNDFIERNGEKINVARIKTYLRDYKDAWREVFDGNVFDTPAPEAPAGKENVDIGDVPADFVPAGNGRWTRGQWIIDVDKDGTRVVGLTAQRGLNGEIVEARNFDELVKKMNRDIPVVFNQNKNKDIRKAPEALKHQPPKIEPAKFKAEQEQIIEEALLEIRDVASLNKFSLLVDQAIFNENEGRQGALRNFQQELTKVAEILRRNPDADINALISERKREFLANFQMRGGVANARTKLNELETQLRDKFIKLRTPAGNGAEEKERNRVKLMEDIANLKKSIGAYEGHLQLVDALEPEIRKASERIKQGFVFDPDATNIPKPTPADVKKKIKDQISAAIDRRQGKLAKYLEERYPNGGAQFQDMTPEKWRTLSPIQKNEYIKEAYSHPVIKGKNGKLYNAVASVNGGSVDVVFNEINAQGQIIRARIGTSSRSISFGGGEVYQGSMFIGSKLDRGADIQTIYNQHAFLYLSKIGITKAKVTAADDGQYVWARVGFKRGSGLGRGDLRALEAPLKFYEDFGPGGLISNDAEYARIKSILAQAAGGAKFSHQDIIFALDDPTGDKPRMEYVKQWFKPNLGFPGGILKFSEQKVGGTPPRRPRRARAPRVTASGGV